MAESEQNLLERIATRRRGLTDYDLPWLREARGQGLARFSELGVPGRKHEHWKYTPVQNIARGDYWQAAAAGDLDAPGLEPFLMEGLETNRLVFVNGRYAESLSKVRDTADGLVIEDFAGALHRRPELVRRYFNTLPDETRFPFAAVNTGLCEHGAVIVVAENTELSHPVHLVFINTDTGGQFSIHPRLLVVGGEHSRFEIIEHYGSIGAPQSMTNIVGELFLDAGARCRHTKVLQEADSAIHLGATYVRQDRDSAFEAHSAYLGGGLARNELGIQLAGPGGECRLDGFYLARGREHLDNHTTVDHQAPHCSSREYYKGLVRDRARAVFNGRIHIHPGAQKTDAELHNKNLLLSNQAEVDTKPELEIYADDVKCAHGATIGELDAREIYYLESRGIDRRRARTMLSLAFINEIIDRLPYAPLRELSRAVIEHRMLSEDDEQ